MRNPRPDDSKPEPEIRALAAAAIERCRTGRVIRPLARVKAWDGLRREIPVVSAQEVWNAWQRFRQAQEAALAGGEIDNGMLELHDEWLRLSKLWLNAPSCLLVSD